MTTFSRYRSRPQHLQTRTLLTVALLACVPLAGAQNPPAGSTSKPSWRAPKITNNAQGTRLEGGAVFTTPEMTVTAPVIELIRNGGGSYTQIKAHQSVSFKMNTTPRPGALPVHIDVHSNEAVADLTKSTLVLTGNVDGEYTVGTGRPNKLHGSVATLTMVNQTLNVDVEGGAEGVRLELPPEETKPKPQPGQVAPVAPVAALGTVIITAQRATLNTVLSSSEKPVRPNASNANPGTAHFIGNAHAVSTDGPTKFDVSAPEFTLTRVATGSIETLTTVGRTHMMVDFPPPPAAAPPVQVEIGAARKEPNGGKAAPKKAELGRPTHVEADADVLTVTRPTDTMVLTGQVTGFYRLPPEAGSAATPGEARDYHFTADRVQLHYDAKQGMEIEGTGNPAVIETPAPDLKFGL